MLRAWRIPGSRGAPCPASRRADASIIITGNRGNEKMTEELWSSTERVVPTSFESIMRVECPACADLAVLRPTIDALLDAARSHDANAMRAALHAIDPSINIP